MNEDTKTKLEEKKGAAMGEEELDNVAGGSFEENQDILEVMSRIDPQGVKEFTQNWDQTSPAAKSKLAFGLMKLMNKNGLNTKSTKALEKHTWEVIKK